jgi:type IV secretory pathway TraG/TraD family ATPase VirD4
MFKSTEKNQANKDLLISSIVAGVLVFYVVLALNTAAEASPRFDNAFDVLGADMADIIGFLNPIYILQHFDGGAFLSSLWVSFIVALAIVAFYLDGRKRHHDMEGIEQGEAQWTINTAEEVKKQGKKFKEPKLAAEYRKTMMDETYTKNIMFDNTYGLSMDGRKTRKNLHMLVIGGSGAGKTRFFVKPNILQMNSSYIITDPSGELFRDMGQMLKNNNYDVRVFNTFDTNLSMQYNPLAYLETDPDVTDLVTTLIKNTGEASGDNKYFDDATKLLLSAIILFLIHYCPKSEHDFAHVMQLVVAADVPEGQKAPQSDLDKIFEQVEVVDPHGLALKMYKSFKSTSGKSLKSVLSSTATRLTVFNYAQIERLTCADTISLKTIGDEKCALFIITPPTDNGFNFLVAMMYSQLFSKLYYHYQFECRYLLTDNDYIARPFSSKEQAEHILSLLKAQAADQSKELVRYEYDDMIEKYTMFEVETDEVLLRELREETIIRFKEKPEQFTIKQNTKEEAGAPFHVRMLMDEFANINEIPGFSEVLATVRKYNMSVVIILQSLSQLKKRYEKDYESIIDNCDTFIFLGSKGQETTEYVSKMLGNMTITVRGAGESMGKSKSTSYNYSQTKRELMTPHELVMLPTDEQVVIVKSVYPFKIPKFKLEEHPNFKQCADGDGARLIIQDWFNLEEKITRLEQKRGIEVKREKQEDINRKAQQPVENWMNKQLVGERPVGGKNDKEDEFFF